MTEVPVLVDDRPDAVADVPSGAEPAREASPHDARRRRRDRRARGSYLDGGWPVRVTYAGLGGLLLAYLASLIGQGQHPWPIFNDWAVAGFEMFGSLLCLARALSRRGGRVVPLTLGLGLFMWSLGDLVLTVESQGGVEPPTPSWADLCYLWFFPLTYVAVFVVVRGEVRQVSTPSWLDGAIAGVGAAAVCSAFAFQNIVQLTGGDPATTMTNLAYPVGDLLLLALVVGGATMMGGRRNLGWCLVAVGIGCNVVGDTANLFSNASGPAGFVLDAIAWPASTWFLSAAVWTRRRSADVLELQRPSTFLIPGVAAIGALGVLLAGNVHPTSDVALALATATLALVGVRLARSLRSMRTLSLERREQALTDELTGLRNRRYLSNVLDGFFAEQRVAGDQRVAFLFVDLDHFKQVNDTFGHVAGDELLKQLGPRMASCLRPGDQLVRLGGDEFVVLLLDCDRQEAAAIATRLTDALTRPFAVGRMQATVAASIGIALAPDDATDATGLLWSADIAMYRAKVSGQPFASYQPDLDKTGNRVQLLDELRVAIDEHQLMLFYQPQLDLKSGRIEAVEALIRWAHPALGILSPAEFLPFAEEAGLMGAITELVLREALDQCAAWRCSGRPMSVAVNVSASVLLDPDFVGLVHDLLSANGMPPDALVLEITETSVIDDFDRAQEVILRLRALGVAVSIDDFGAGFTALAYLSGLAVRELKLDRTFIGKLVGADAQRGLELIRSTIELGHALGLRIVAEGVEDRQTLEVLGDIGCDIAQGYLISVPKPAAQISMQSSPAQRDGSALK